MSLKVSTASLDGYTVVGVGGEVDLANADMLRAELLKILDRRGRQIVVDLGEMSFLTSQGVRVLATVWEEAGRRGGRLLLAGPQRPVEKVLRITGLWDLVEVFPSVEAACNRHPAQSSDT